jgi:hypothetical protein
MIYLINFFAVAAIPLLIAGYSAHLAAKILESPERRNALCIVWVLAAAGVLLSGCQQLLMLRADRLHELKQEQLQTEAGINSLQLQEKLDKSLRRQEDVQAELGSILKFLHTPQLGMDSRRLADQTSQMVEKAMHR